MRYNREEEENNDNKSTYKFLSMIYCETKEDGS